LADAGKSPLYQANQDSEKTMIEKVASLNAYNSKNILKTLNFWNIKRLFTKLFVLNYEVDINLCGKLKRCTI
jgi:hypothetical protein